MWKKVLISVAGLFAALLVLIALQPSEFAVERSARVEAPPEKAFGLVADFKEWPKWSPWEKLDPSMKKTLSGSASGVGAVYAWEGNDEVGAGRMQITEAKSPEQIVIALSFLKPFQAENVTTFRFRAEGTSTQVTWLMTGHNNFFSKAFSLFMDMDKMIGADFEKGLSALKATAEAK